MHVQSGSPPPIKTKSSSKTHPTAAIAQLVVNYQLQFHDEPRPEDARDLGQEGSRLGLYRLEASRLTICYTGARGRSWRHAAIYGAIYIILAKPECETTVIIIVTGITISK